MTKLTISKMRDFFLKRICLMMKKQVFFKELQNQILIFNRKVILGRIRITAMFGWPSGPIQESQFMEQLLESKVWLIPWKRFLEGNYTICILK